MNSSRYPGKVLAPFLGKPLLAHIVDRIKSTKLKSSIILATSNKRADDPLEIYGKYLGIIVERGSLDDVSKRFAFVLKKHKCDAFFRVCGDSPLLSTSLFNQALSIYKKNSYDLITNVFPRTFPRGMSVELFNTETFLKYQKKISKDLDKEHLTRYFYKNSKNFKIFNLKSSKTIKSNLKFAVDEIKDLKKLEAWFVNKGKNYEKLFTIKT
tara:strand:- start:244 stop:876 length:633 start_codon:yes stop_codon:yes gene_type:complete